MVVTTNDERIDLVPRMSKELWLADAPMDFLNHDNIHLKVILHRQRSIKREVVIVLSNTMYESEMDFVNFLSGGDLCVYNWAHGSIGLEKQPQQDDFFHFGG